jgi:hypothetical protein
MLSATLSQKPSGFVVDGGAEAKKRVYEWQSWNLQIRQGGNSNRCNKHVEENI